MEKNPKMRHISWQEYGSIASALAKKIKSSGNEYDLVIGVARGGIPVALVVADELGVRIDIINIKSYTEIAVRHKPKIISTLTSGLGGKRLLIVDDLVEEGKTLMEVIRYLKRMKPSTMHTAVLFKKPWSKVNPDFYLKATDRWIVFPWECGEMKRLDRLRKKA
ncbi:MAG: phosphoribosyltransferase [Candidatus Micrarchaeaceae archaeon]